MFRISKVVIIGCFAMVPNYALSAAETSSENSTDQQDASPRQWFDEWQARLTTSMDATANTLDNMFADDQDDNEDARAEGRITFSWEPRTRDYSQTDVRFRVRVTLPALKDRVDLLLSDNEDEAINDAVKVARPPVFEQGDRATVSLRYRPLDDSNFAFRVGAGRRDQFYVKARYRNNKVINDHWSFMYDSELYYYTRDRLGAEIGAIFQRNNDNGRVSRFNTRFYYRDESNDWRWRHEYQYFVPLSSKQAMIYNVLTEGVSEPNYRVQEVYTGARWRTNPLRDWLYFDVEPFVLFLRDEDFKPSFGVALRVEAYYGGN